MGTESLARDRLKRLRTGTPGAGREDALEEVNGLLLSLGEAIGAADGAGSDLVREGLELLGDGRHDEALAEGVDLTALADLGDRLAVALEDAPEGGAPDPGAAWAWLDLVRRPPVLTRIAAARGEPEWMDRILRLVEASRFTVGTLLSRRVDHYGPHVLFRVLRGAGSTGHSWAEVGARVDAIARGLLALRGETATPVAILSENRLDMALVDLACLSAGIVNVMIPASATEEDVSFILEHSGAGILVASTPAQLRKISSRRSELTGLSAVVLLDRSGPSVRDTLSLPEVVARGRGLPAAALEEARAGVTLDGLATIMYTSGTTGRPKGIRFSQRNIVSKRFARALAVPTVGETDVFLSYLPLFHTFGRFLELLGCVFWGATYVFLEDPSLDALAAAMPRIRPSVFISVPKKWIELWEEVGRRVDIEEGSDEEIEEAMHSVVGDRLRWGLSAAGYLDPEIFRFFQRYGVDLCSGFGMTEATGGITMTPPGLYRDDTLGVALPGIELRLEGDGELAIRGPYVMLGYHDTPEGSGLDEEGWLCTGDVMEEDEEGYLRLVDRKKEIYKNIKGESIAPQRIENLFRDFEAIQRVFLVGDHLPYNTLLIVPNLDVSEVDLRSLGEREKRGYFRSLVVSVNRFLAPFERIVDFALLERNFEEDREELTPKGTYRRKIVARNFADVIASMYHRAHLRAAGMGVEIHVPNWLFQTQGLTAGDVRLEGEHLTLAPTGASLTVESRSRDANGEVVQIGSCLYRTRRRTLDLGSLLATPALWLGNDELIGFAPLDTASRVRWLTASRAVEKLGRVAPYRPAAGVLLALEEALERPPILEHIDAAARVLGSKDEAGGLLALRVLARALHAGGGVLPEVARLALRTAADSPSPLVRQRGLAALLPVERDQDALAALERFCLVPGFALDKETVSLLCEEELSPAKLEALARSARAVAERKDGDGPGRQRTAASLLNLLGEYGAAHPARFEELRITLTRLQVFSSNAEFRTRAEEALTRLSEGFRGWIGPVQRIAIDAEEGAEYRWKDVVNFEDGVPEEDRQRLLDVISRTSVLREAVFLFSGEVLLRLADIPRGGIWVSLLGAKHGKAVYRATVHTHMQGAFDVALNLNRTQSPEEVAEEMSWLIVTGGPWGGEPLAEKFGGYWEDYDLWSEEFISGETLEKALPRLARVKDENLAGRLLLLWPYLIGSAAQAFIEFWLRTGRRLRLSDPSASDVIVPTHDYQTGARIISVSGREPAPPVGELLDDLWRKLAVPLEERHPEVAGMASPDAILSAFLEAVGVDEGLRLLEEIPSGSGPVTSLVPPFVDEVRTRGFVPRRLRSAIERYHRWAVLAPDAPPSAHAQTVHELLETYRLIDLQREYPGSHIRFFRETVFRDSTHPLARGLDEILAALARGELDGEAAVERLTALRSHIEHGSPEEYFLARLTYPHLQPEDEVGFLSTVLGGTRQTDIVVSLTDNEGRQYRVRQPVNPKEVGRLHRLFLTAKLDVTFRPEHQYLVAVSERGALIGGIFYEVDEEHHSAHLEKIVVAERVRKAGVGEGLMNEFFNRLRAGGVESVTTGFFRPSYFYRFGFTVGKRQAGLVKTL